MLEVLVEVVMEVIIKIFGFPTRVVYLKHDI